MRKFIAIVFMALMAWPAAAQLAAPGLYPLSPHPEGVSWPTNEWETGDMNAETAARVQPLIDRAMAGEKQSPMGETRAIIIIHKGRMVFETYREGFTEDTPQMSWSLAKSFTSALVGRAVQLGLIESIDDIMPTPFPEGDPRGQISWLHWLNMTEGLSNHELDREAAVHENVIAQMMFGRGKFDVAQFAVDELEVESEPGEVWKYSTAGYHLIGWALVDVQSEGRNKYDFDDAEFRAFRVSALRDIRHAVKFGDMPESQHARAKQILARALNWPPEKRWQNLQNVFFYAWTRHKLLNLMGVKDFQPEFDSAGTYLGGSHIWATPRDYAKFGYLYLRDGVWEGERLLPEGWVDFSRSKSTGANTNLYGAGFWITAGGEEPTMPQAPRTPPWDAFNANGSEGQTIWIVPSRDLVIVRTGQMENTFENWNLLFEWCQEISRAFPEVEAVR